MSNIVPISQAARYLKEYSPLILTVTAVIGAVSTTGLTATATYKAYQEIEHERERRAWDAAERDVDDEEMNYKDYISLCWRFYVPAAFSLITTVSSIIALNRVSMRDVAAATALYTMTNDSFKRYKDKVIEKLGESEEEKIRVDVIKDEIVNNPPTSNSVYVSGSDETLFYDRAFGRYFKASIEAVRRAENLINQKVLHSGEATVEDFYDYLSVDSPEIAREVGWVPEELFILHFVPTITPEDKPCIVLDYNYIKGVDKVWSWG